MFQGAVVLDISARKLCNLRSAVSSTTLLIVHAEHVSIVLVLVKLETLLSTNAQGVCQVEITCWLRDSDSVEVHCWIIL